MAYAIAWGIYVLMAVLLMAGFERYLAGLITVRRLRIALRALLAILLFTPGVVSADHLYVVPASIAVLFNLLAHSRLGLLQALLPLLLAQTLVFGLLFLREALPARRRAQTAD